MEGIIDTISYGYCHCGCGQKTDIAPKTASRTGAKKGEPLRFIHGHNNHKLNIPSRSEHEAWWQESTSTPYGFCWCGCGSRTKLAARTNSIFFLYKGRPNRYSFGHQPPPERPDITNSYVIEDHGYHTPCWIWQRYINCSTGYGMLSALGVKQPAHRVSYENYVGPIPAGLQIDHSCRVRACVNPDHLEAVTNVENVHRGNACKLSVEKAQRIRTLYQTGNYTQQQIADIYGIDSTTVCNVMTGKTWTK